ncbi:MAG: glycosyltransferase family 2 protein [bacterium]|nr:glycosyltransferase family 2 protein [bacterium]
MDYTQRTVSVVVVNYNGARTLARCLDAVVGEPRVREVILVDDASEDSSLTVAQQFPVTVVSLAINSGPTHARNAGAARATGEHLLFLDSDVVPAPGYVEALANFLDEHPIVGVASGRIVGEGGGRIWWSFGHDGSPLRDLLQGVCINAWKILPFLRTTLERIAEPFTLNFVPDIARRVDWVVEMACMTPRTLFSALGGFDERYWMFYEGPDYCARAREVGREVWYAPVSSALHLDAQTHPTTRRRHFLRSRLRYYLAHPRLW